MREALHYFRFGPAQVVAEAIKVRAGFRRVSCTPRGDYHIIAVP
ncbi:MAG: hypothetical protein OXL38_15890 [Gammaproteobacteria bacterium]|nr:hypothetical protein [Gammaproteobacteria bacterium]